MRAFGGALSVLLLSCAGAGGEGHDVVPPSHDVQVRGADATNPSAQGYDYVAKRPLAVVALAEARGLDVAVAHAAVDRLADSLDTCATDQGHQGRLVDGAARVAVQIDDSGNITGSIVKIDPGPGVAENAALCFVAPVKMLTFPPADAGARGFAVEAIWGRVIPGK
ncbi:MAG TPA: hypothetical protein VIJ22_19620 [Polyangiaceae bacterium]